MWTSEKNYPKFYTLLNDPRNHELANAYWTTFTRKLHNVLAGAKTLTDHALTVCKHIADYNRVFKVRYDALVKTHFTDDPLSRFISDFRNYMLHYGLINYILRHTFDAQKGPVSRFILNVNDLKAWAGWKSLGRRFLTELDEKTSVQDILQSYDAKIQAFYEEFTELVSEIFSREIDVFERKTEKYHSLVEELNRLLRERG